MVIVAHDRYFLDKIVSRTIELAFERIEEYPGNYTKYLRLREERMERRLREYEFSRLRCPYGRVYPPLQSRAAESRGARERKIARSDGARGATQDLPELHLNYPHAESGLVVISTQNLLLVTIA